MINWIIENAQWLFNLAGAGIGGLFIWHKEKKAKALEIKLQAADARLRELDVDDKNVDITSKIEAAAKTAVDNVLAVKNAEVEGLIHSYENRVARLKSDLEETGASLNEAQRLKEEAGKLADSYKALIDRLQAYTTYLKGLLDLNGITYKEFEDEH